MAERVLTHWKTSAAGVALTAVLWYLLSSFHCQFPSDSAAWVTWGIAAGPAILGILSRDH